MKRKMPLIKHVMTPFPYSIESSLPLPEARNVMHEHSIRHLPVTENHKLIGVITDRDLAVAYSIGSHFADPETLPISVMCTREPFAVDLHTDLATVAREMAERHIGSVVVLKDGNLAGIFTTTDCCRFLADLLNDLYGGGPDEEPEAA